MDTEEDPRTGPRTAFEVLEDVEAIFCELDLKVGCEDVRDVEMVVIVDLLDTLGTLPFVDARDVLKGLPCPKSASVVGLPELCNS